MANLSSCYLKATGEKVEKAYFFLKKLKLEEEPYFDLYSVDKEFNNGDCMIDTLEIKEENDNKILIVQGQGRWAAPVSFFEKYIFKKFSLNGFISDAEPGNDYYYKSVWTEGEREDLIRDNYFCVEHFNDEGANYWVSYYFDDFANSGESWHTMMKPVVNVFKEAGYDETWIEKSFGLRSKRIVFIVADIFEKGKDVAEGLSRREDIDILKTVTTLPVSDDLQALYQMISKEEMNSIVNSPAAADDILEKDGECLTLYDDLFNGKETMVKYSTLSRAKKIERYAKYKLPMTTLMFFFIVNEENHTTSDPVCKEHNTVSKENENMLPTPNGVFFDTENTEEIINKIIQIIIPKETK